MNLLQRILSTVILVLAAELLIAQFGSVQLSKVILEAEAIRRPMPQKYGAFELDSRIFERRDEEVFELDLPLGVEGQKRFVLEPYKMMQEALAKKYPYIRTYIGHSEDGDVAFVDITGAGFHGVIRTRGGMQYYIDPVEESKGSIYISYAVRDYSYEGFRVDDFKCALDEQQSADDVLEQEMQGKGISFRSSEPVQLYSYVLALATTSEYCQFHGGDKASTMDAVVTAINRINGIFNNDLAIRFVLHADTDELFFCSEPDGYSNCNTSAMINENPGIIRSRLGSSTYDIGHVFGRFGGGLAQLQSVCGVNKERGVTCHPNPINDPFYVGYVSHEIGHQFGAHHIFNGAVGACGSNISPVAAYEPGAGTTIMSYAGLCGSDNVKGSSDPYFNSFSIQQITQFIRNNGGVCASKTTSGNTEPTVIIPIADDLYIPIETPFELYGEGEDIEDGVLLFTWEQHDLGPQSNLGEPTNGMGPLFRSRPPQPESYRTFPRIEDLVDNRKRRSELLPSVSRELNFRLTARDNNADGGGTSYAQIKFNATADAGPFVVTNYNDRNISIQGGNRILLQWDVANTDKVPVNCQFVDIYYSTNGGLDFDNILLARTPNDGEEYLFVPDISGTKFRLKVKASENIFFDINDEDLEVVKAEKPGFMTRISPQSLKICTPQSGQVVLETEALLGYNETIDFEVLTSLPEGIHLSMDNGSVLPGESANISVQVERDVAGGIVPIAIQISSDSVSYIEHLYLEIHSSDYSDQVLTKPSNGLNGAGISQIFEWEPSVNASYYRFELAKDINFTDMVHSADALYEPMLNLSFLELEENTVYYWRILPYNDACGMGQASRTSSFKTGLSICQEYVAQDVPKTVDNKIDTAYSVLNITEDFEIEDVNISKLVGNHGNVSDLIISIISPSGERARLVSRKCFGQTVYNVRFDDDVLSTLSCPMDQNKKVQPRDPLSIFDGESVKGTWTLEVRDVQTGKGGILKEWSIEFCSKQSVAAPNAVLTDTLRVYQNQRKSIGPDLLEITDAMASPSELVISIINVPLYGALYLGEQLLEPGSQFTQKDVEDLKLSYQHTGAYRFGDSFRFSVSNPQGGWIGGLDFPILIDKPVAVSVPVEDIGILVYPNPAEHFVYVQMPEELSAPLDMVVYDLNGKVVLRQDQLRATERRIVDVSQLASGIYTLHFFGQSDSGVMKMVISR